MKATESVCAVPIVDTIISQAIERGASDIHFEPEAQSMRIRLRIDGVLSDQELIDYSLMHQVIARIKVLAHINVTQKRIPQDGKFSLVHKIGDIDLRVSTFPSIHGEKMVVRILHRAREAIGLDKLGLSQKLREGVLQLVTRSQGFFLVAGPTGSGKTTTLYAALNTMNSQEKHIITLEDPVEYSVARVIQGQINCEAGFTFERGMRALLRQDPDIVMVGEIRDKQTARIAIEAALTGHMVLSTVHTGDAPNVIMRLMDMAIEPYLLNASVSGILAQRLARILCLSCKSSQKPTDEQKRFFDQWNMSIDTVWNATGCMRCNNTGYKGRTGIFELISMTSALRGLIVQQPSFDQVVTQARADGWRPLFLDGLDKVQEGIISLPELIRVAW